MDTEVFYRNLADKQSKLIAALEHFYEIAISDAPRAQKNKSIGRLSRIASSMDEQLAAKDKPKWVDMLIGAGGAVSARPDDANVFKIQFEKIRVGDAAIRRHKWHRRDTEVSLIIDFDEIVEKHRNKEVVSALFDKLIESLDTLIQCEELDSRRVIEDLERILATVRKSQKATFHSQLMSARVASRYMKNFARAWMLDSKVAKAAVKAAEDTAEELGMTMEEAKDKIQSELIDVGDDLNERLAQSVPKRLTRNQGGDSD